VALVIALGILAMICVAVIAFIAAMRLERASARLESDRATLRGLHHVALAAAMQDVTQQLRGRVYPVAWRAYRDEEDSPVAPPSSGPCLGSFYAQTEQTTFPATTVQLFTGAGTNLVPRAIHAAAAAVESVWLPVTSVLVDPPADDQPSDPLAPLMDNVVIGRIAYLVMDCSGFLPPMPTNALDTRSIRYPSQRHLPSEWLDHTLYLAHDPDPEQRFTVKPEYAGLPEFADGRAAPGLFSTLVTNKFDVNAWTRDPTNWLMEVKAGFAAAGFTNAPEKLAWNLYNLLDEDRIPQHAAVATRPPSRVTYGFENLPMINEVAVSNVAAGAYSVSVELWYPFEPEQSPENLVLAVGIYTNGPPDVSSLPAPSENLGPFGFTNVVPLLHSPGRQFHVASSTRHVVFAPEAPDQPSPPIGSAHPIYIWPRLYLLCTNTATYVCVDEALLDAPAGTDTIDNFDHVDIIEWRSTGSWQARNPFFNLTAQDGDFGGLPTLWARNANLDPGFEYPLFHLNRPMLSAGELGYLGLAQAGTGTVSLATAAGAALLDRFTALPPNRAERASASRVQPNSTYPDVIASLFRDPIFSRPVADAAIPPPDLLTNAWFAARAAWTNAYPGESWNTFEDLLPAVAEALDTADWPTDDGDVAADETRLPRALMIEDLLRGIARQATFRQNLLVILVAAQRLSPRGHVTADLRAAVTVIRDAYTGHWAVQDWCPLDE